MSTSFFRGKVVTSPELKGSFGEAADELEGFAFDVLYASAKENSVVSVSVHENACSTIRGPDGERTRSVLFITHSGIIVELKEDGGFEIWEGGE